MKLKKPICLVGMMGAGKTSFGRKIAKKLNAEFFDLDNEIKVKTGYSPKEIFNYFGETLLNDTEFAVIQELMKTPCAIIATGDSTIDNKKAWDFLKKNTVTIWLNIDLKLISVRLKPNEDRPYLEEQDGQGMLKFITALYHKRAKKYKESHLTIHKPILSRKMFLQKLTNAINKLQTNSKIKLDEIFQADPVIEVKPRSNNVKENIKPNRRAKKNLKSFKKNKNEQDKSDNS